MVLLTVLLWWFSGEGVGRPQAGAEEKERTGRALYREHCYTCHETEEGIGPSLSPRVVAGYSSEEALGNYLRLTMPYGAPGTLDEGEYDAIAFYLFRREGVAPPVGGAQKQIGERSNVSWRIIRITWPGPPG